MKLLNVLVVYYAHNYRTLAAVEKALCKNNVSYKCVNREKMKKSLVAGRDMVIVVGGDGTFLRTTHLIDKTPVFLISSDIRYNEAFYGRATRKDFEKKIRMIIQGKFKITKLARLEARINGKKLPMLAVNEVFMGNRHPYHTSRYMLKVKGKSEFQKSSGVIITTRSGSQGWAKSASEKKLAVPENGFGYVVREPYIGRLTKSKMLQGALSRREKIQIESMTHKGIVVIDSSDTTFKLVDGQKLEVKVSNKPLNFVEF